MLPTDPIYESKAPDSSMSSYTSRNHYRGIGRSPPRTRVWDRDRESRDRGHGHDRGHDRGRDRELSPTSRLDSYFRRRNSSHESRSSRDSRSSIGSRSRDSRSRDSRSRDSRPRSSRSSRDERGPSYIHKNTDRQVHAPSLSRSTSPTRRKTRFDAVDPIEIANSVAAKINAGLLARDVAYRKSQQVTVEQEERQEQQEAALVDDSRYDDSSSSSVSKLSMGSNDTSGYDSPQPVPRRASINRAYSKAPHSTNNSFPKTVEAPASSPAVDNMSSEDRTHFTRDIDINGFRNKHLLTKSSTQAEIQLETGCSVTSRGRFMDKGEMNTNEKPLHLHLEGPTTESISLAVNKIQRILHQDMYEDHRNPLGFFRNVPVVNNSGLSPFQLRGLVVGPSGQNVKHIQQASGCRIQIKGIGSRYLEGVSEEQVPLYVHVSGHDENSVAIAEHLILDLMRVVESSAHKRFRMRA